jgi:cleavage and polyadenylation specificity factor subunit 4
VLNYVLFLTFFSPHSGECKELECPFKHSLDDVKECNMYKLGFCIYGPNCRYKHTKQPGEACSMIC